MGTSPRGSLAHVLRCARLPSAIGRRAVCRRTALVHSNGSNNTSSSVFQDQMRQPDRRTGAAGHLPGIANLLINFEKQERSDTLRQHWRRGEFHTIILCMLSVVLRLQACFRKGAARAYVHAQLVHAQWLHVAQLHMRVFIKRVATDDNIADLPSREVGSSRFRTDPFTHVMTFAVPGVRHIAANRCS